MKERRLAPNLPMPDYTPSVTEVVESPEAKIATVPESQPGIAAASNDAKTPTSSSKGTTKGAQENNGKGAKQPDSKDESKSEKLIGLEDRGPIPKREYIAPTPGHIGTIEEIPVDKVLASPYQPRLYFDQQSIEDLAENILEVGGLVEPIKVRPMANGEFELISGERRLRAFRHNRADMIQAWVRPLDDDSAFKEACAENLNREDLTLYEKAVAYKKALDSGKARSQRALAILAGVNRMEIQRVLKIFDLPNDALAHISKNPECLVLSHIEPLANATANGNGKYVTEGLELVTNGRLKRDALLNWIEKQTKPKPGSQVYHQYQINGKPLGRMSIKAKRVTFNLEDPKQTAMLVAAFEEAVSKLGASKG